MRGGTNLSLEFSQPYFVGQGYKWDKSSKIWSRFEPWTPSQKSLEPKLGPGKAQGRKTGSAHALGALPSLAPLCIMYNFKNICFKICNFLLCLSCVSNKYDCGRGKYKKLCEGPRRISLDIRKSWRNIWSVSLWLFSKISFSQDFSGVKKKLILFSMNW